MHLVMFDIDGTLVHSHGFDGDLFAAAVKHELGVQVDETWSSYQHVTDSGVLEDVLRERVAVAERQQAYRRVKARFVGLVRDFTADQPKAWCQFLGLLSSFASFGAKPEWWSLSRLEVGVKRRQ